MICLKVLFLIHVGVSLTFPYSNKNKIRSVTSRNVIKMDNKEREELIASTRLSSYEIFLHEWESFKVKYNKVYQSDDEHLQRMQIFTENSKLIAEHNDLYNKGVVTYSLEINHLGDWTAEERKRLLGYKNRGHSNNNKTYLTLPYGSVIPKEKDWRESGAVTDVKNQGDCGSCWAFSAIGALEGQYYRKNKVLVELSEQNLIDCSNGYGNEGCSGGTARMAFKYIELGGGIDTAESYPYEAFDNECRYQEKYSITTTKGYMTIPANEKSLQMAVAAFGPISVAIHAGGYSYAFYKKGIYYNATCLQDFSDLDHEVLLVGYGHINNTGDYWLVKNSWGEDWGENGYVKIARNRDNNCGITADATLPIIN